MSRQTISTLLTRSSALAAMLAALFQAPLSAQSLLANRGLGFVIEPQGARSFGLGGVSLGLPRGEFSWTNPAGAVGLPAAGLTASFQFDAFDARLGQRDTDGSTARFPLLMAAFPIGERWAVTAGFGGFLDQNFAVESRDTLLVGPDSLAVLDRSSSDGGVSRLRLAAGYGVTPRLSVAVGADIYTGGVRRFTGRIFPDEDQPGCCSAEWRYSGVGAAASADWAPSEAVAVAVGVTAGGTLRAESDDATIGGREYSLPATVTAGASARLTPNLLAAVSADWAGWSTLNESLARAGGARDGWAVQGGLEWDALQIAGRAIPLRLGGRQRALPFRWGSGAAEWADERAITGGTGIVLGGGATRADLSVERGTRGSAAAGLEESFWRIVFSTTVLGR